MDMNHENHHDHEMNYTKEYIKFGVLMATVAAVSAYFASAFGTGAVADYMRFFMGMFFVVFASFKFWNLETFPDVFANYDLIAKKYIAYAYAFPFIQMVLGVLYLGGMGGAGRDVFTLVITGVGAYGVIKEVFMNKSKLQCACLGDVIKLPLSTVTLIEDAGMAIMALMVLFL